MLHRCLGSAEEAEVEWLDQDELDSCDFVYPMLPKNRKLPSRSLLRESGEYRPDNDGSGATAGSMSEAATTAVVGGQTAPQHPSDSVAVVLKKHSTAKEPVAKHH